MNSIIKSGLVVLCLTSLAGCSGNNNVGVKEIKKPTVIHLGSEELINVGFSVQQPVRYNGMTGDNQRFLLSGIWSNSINTYYPANGKQIRFYGRLFGVDFVTPDSIGLTYIGRADEK